MINKNFDETRLEIDRNVVILQNDSKREEFIRMYAENLINNDESNELESIKRSKEVPNVYFARYKNALDIELVQKRAAKRPNLDQKW